jgi:hypothetical protein
MEQEGGHLKTLKLIMPYAQLKTKLEELKYDHNRASLPWTN